MRRRLASSLLGLRDHAQSNEFRSSSRCAASVCHDESELDPFPAEFSETLLRSGIESRFDVASPNLCDLILDLQEAFLTHGYHVIDVPSLGIGRSLVCACLANMSCFSAVSCVSVVGSLPVSVVSVYDELRAFSPELSADVIDSYILEYFYFDVCWIECSADLVSSGWFKHFRERLDDYNIVKSSSVVALRSL